MTESFDGQSIAEQRIAEEAVRRTGFLDLGSLGLTVLPGSLFALGHLRRLNLGRGIGLDDGSYFAVEDYYDDNRVLNRLAAELDRLRHLPHLRHLSLSSTDLDDLAPLGGLSALQTLDCGNTQVSDLAPLAGLSALQTLNCSMTQVSDLAPLAGLSALQTLHCDRCPLQSLPEAVRNLFDLQKLHLYGCRIPGIPPEVLSQNSDDNCLSAVRAHFRDLEAGSVAATDVKLIVLGNGRVGKTQIVRRLKNEDYDSSVPSTHGIIVTSALLEAGEAEPTRLNIWDFGGQDLYHGTHALFLRTSAIFLAVWARETEDAETNTYDGIVFRNQRLPYWLAYIRHLASSDSPVLIVQTRCDRLQDRAMAPPLTDADTAAIGLCVPLPYSALNDLGRPGLDEGLRNAIAFMRECQGTAAIGIGRMHVLRALQDMRDADAALKPGKRRYRVISQAHFRQLCDQAGQVSDPIQLLRYLHNAGTVFYRDGLFGDRVVLDQGWALDAIYAVFNREKSYRELKRLRGRFTRPLLELLVWGEHGAAEQKLFLDMMRSCGICFVHRQGPHNDEDATEYIAPDLLPERETVKDEVAAVWDDTLPSESEDIPFEMLHPGLVRGLICEIGAQAGSAAVYWFGGVAVYDTVTRSHALIEQPMTDAWHGSIRIRTQGGQAALLLERLAGWIEQRSGRDGLKAVRTKPKRVVREEAAEPSDKLPVSPGPVPVAATEYFVSYAWGDDLSPEGREREKIVDRLCAAAEARGIRIVRDKDTLKIGDRISTFMRRIGAGDRVFVILSEKYLRSAFCMFELCEIWRHSRADAEDFGRRVRVYALADAQAASPLARLRIAVWWKTQHDEISAIIKEYGGEVVGTQDFAAFRRMAEFYRSVPDILATMFDTVQPRSFEELERFGFAEVASI